MKKLLGAFFLFIHSIFIGFASWIVLFSTKIKTLIIVGIILNLNFIYALWVDGCPLTRLELENSGTDLVSLMCKNLPMNYTQDKKYTATMQILITGLCLYGIKIMGLLFFREFVLPNSNL